MFTDDFPDLGVTPAVPGGRTTVAFAATAIEADDAFEEEEEEAASPETTAGYGSLLSLGASMRKKKPLIVVDPIEAENEARRVQFVAAQQLVDPDEAEGVNFLEGLAHFAELGAAEAEETDEEYVLPDNAIELPVEDEETGGELAGDCAVIICAPEVGALGDATPLESDEAPVGPAMAVDQAEPVAEAADREMAISVEALARIYQAGDIAPADEPETPQGEPVPTQPEIRPGGHSLRARMPNRPPRKTLAAHALALLFWLYGGLIRRPG